MNFNKLKSLSEKELLHFAQHLGIRNITKIKKQDIIIYIVNQHLDEDFIGEGVIEILKDGFGFLRSDNGYSPGPNDIYVSPSQIKKFTLRTGDTLSGIIRPPKEGERYCALLKVERVNLIDVSFYKKKKNFEYLTPLHANYRLHMERLDGEDLTPRILDLVAPIGKGQRGLIVAPPKAGKTMLLQNIAKSIIVNHNEFDLIMLLIDERPEEVTEMQRIVTGEVIASTFDEPATKHIKVAEMVLERAKRLVEQKKNVIILLDSLTRLARAYNTVMPKSGRVLTGGLDANALTRPKRFFGAARNVAEGGSLTIIATALVDTGSKMDEVIYEEFKGTGNMELHLSRKIADKRIYPAIDYNRSGTRKEELLISQEELKNIWVLRKMMNHLSDIEIMEFMHEKLILFQNNYDFLNSLKSLYSCFYKTNEN